MDIANLLHHIQLCNYYLFNYVPVHGVYDDNDLFHLVHVKHIENIRFCEKYGWQFEPQRQELDLWLSLL